MMDAAFVSLKAKFDSQVFFFYMLIMCVNHVLLWLIKAKNLT
jgi:hypothetical protein